MRRRHDTRTAPVRLAMAVLLATTLAAALVPSIGTGEPQPGPVVPQPVLGVADSETKLMGAAPEGEPGEAWAYRQLPLSVAPPVVAGKPLEFAALPDSGSPDPQFVFSRYTHAGGWQVAETPAYQDGQLYRGLEPNERSARITPNGGGILVGKGRNRVDPKQRELTVLQRDPGGRFTVLPGPPSEVLYPAEGVDPAEVLATETGIGRIAVAAFEENGHTGALFGVLGREVEGAVLHFDGQSWSREPVDVPSGSREFQILAIDATELGNAWMVARAPGSGRGVLLFERTEGGAGPHWVERDLHASLFSDGATPGLGIDDVQPLGGAAQALTVRNGGVWIDGRMHAAGGVHHFTLFFDTAAVRVTGSWCDARDLEGGLVCPQPLEARLSEQLGYRSFAWDGDGFGTRVISNPLDPGGDAATNRGTYLSLEGSRFVRKPGAGGNFRPSAAFSAPDDGWLEGPVHITRQPEPRSLRESWPLSLRAPLTSVAPAPGKPRGSVGSEAVAVGLDGAVVRYSPGEGWVREFLLTSGGAVSRPPLRAVAWPEPARAHAVGDVGAMWLWRADTGLWEKDPAAPIGFESHLMDVAFDPSNPDRGYAVGRTGALLRYGKSWVQEELPGGFASADFTQVAFAGSEALVAAGRDLLVNDGAGWRVDPGVRGLLDSTDAPGRLFAVAGLPDGGAVAAGEHIVIERDGPSGPWRFSDQPLPNSTMIAAAALREGGRVRALVSIVPRLRYPPPDVLPDPDPNIPPPVLGPFRVPPDGYVLRETGSGWRDEQHNAFNGSGIDRPVKPDAILDFDVDAGGVGWAVGGWSGEANSAGRGSSGNNPTGKSDRQRVQTSAVLRYGDNAPPPGTSSAPVGLGGGLMRVAVAGHAQCELPCADLAGQGIAPDRILSSTLSKVKDLSSQPGGPRFLLYAGGRSAPGADQSRATAEAERYSELLRSEPALPVFPAVSAGDTADAAHAYRNALEPMPAPVGAAPAPPGIDTSGIPGAAAGSGARTHYAFDTSGTGGRMRVIVIDNSAGSLEASDPHQNPPEAQRPWLAAALADAKAKSIPAIVVGSRDLNTRFNPKLNVASDGDETARLLVEGGASAYFFERPEENRTYRVPSGSSETIPAFGTGTLGYRSPLSDPSRTDKPDSLFGDAGFLLAEIHGARRDPVTNRAPVTTRMIPVVEELSVQALDGVLLRRSRPSLFQGIGRKPRAGDRWGRVSSADGNANPPGSDPYVAFPAAQCLVAGCSTRIEPEYEFVSSDPDIGDFVKQDPASANLRKPVLGADGKVVSSALSGLFCPFNAGTTTVTLRAGSLSHSQRVTVLAGSVQRPCGTRPLRPDRFRRPAAGAAAAPPAPAPAATQPASLLPPPPPPPPAVAEPSPPRPPAPPPDAFVPSLEASDRVPPVPLPPPPAVLRPSPPSGGMGRVHEEKREEEAAPEDSQAFARYHPDGQPLPGSFLIGILVLAAFAGATIRARPRPRGRSAAPVTTQLRDKYPRRRP